MLVHEDVLREAHGFDEAMDRVGKQWEKKQYRSLNAAASSALVEELAAAKAEVGSPEAAPQFRGLSAAADGAGGADIGSVRPFDADVASMAFLAEYLAARGGSAAMVDGWYSKTFTWPGMPGKASNTVYYHPNGEAFNSHKEVARHLGLISERPKEPAPQPYAVVEPARSTAPPPPSRCRPARSSRRRRAAARRRRAAATRMRCRSTSRSPPTRQPAKRKRAEPAPAPSASARAAEAKAEAEGRQRERGLPGYDEAGRPHLRSCGPVGGEQEVRRAAAAAGSSRGTSADKLTSYFADKAKDWRRDVSAASSLPDLAKQLRALRMGLPDGSVVDGWEDGEDSHRDG